jgi:hypothetical protein
MGWSVGFDSRWNRWIGYGVPAYCDHPKCQKTIDRGLAYVCCDEEPYGGERGCGLYFCEEHALAGSHRCPRCANGKPPYRHPKPEHPDWLRHVLTDESWAEWRGKHPKQVATLQAQLASAGAA